ncbi:hypothetical protein F5Y16DRAFT_366443 [Xylariaceae sp. FL0255]|nr:hypothetical protein F5Y16DRAFT_366443 [Xylariaceae sp. FL0255]
MIPQKTWRARYIYTVSASPFLLFLVIIYCAVTLVFFLPLFLSSRPLFANSAMALRLSTPISCCTILYCNFGDPMKSRLNMTLMHLAAVTR